MSFHYGLRFFLSFCEVLGFRKFRVLENKWWHFLSELYYNVHFVLFESFYLLYLVLYIPQISLKFVNEAEKDENSNDVVSITMNYLYWYYGFIYCFLFIILLVHFRI